MVVFAFPESTFLFLGIALAKIDPRAPTRQKPSPSLPIEAGDVATPP
jgi:hypothetical protein